MNSLVLQLRSWQLREWLFRTTKGLGWFCLIAAVTLSFCCFLDWYVDLFEATPLWLRTGMSTIQIVLYAAATYFLLFRNTRPSLETLASQAETELPVFGHRLVTTLQLHRPEAKTEGMSKVLIAEVAQETDQLLSEHRLSRLAKMKPFWIGLGLIGIVALYVVAQLTWNREVVVALLQRQVLMNVDIPRSVTIENQTIELWPSGDSVELRFRVRGPVEESTVGQVRVTPDGQPSEKYDVVFLERLDSETSLFVTQLPPASQPFQFHARLSDGRMREPGQVRFEPRPVVQELSAYVLMPKYVDPEGRRRYERITNQGEVYAHEDSSVRVVTTFSKPVKVAQLILTQRTLEGAEQDLPAIPITMNAERTLGEAFFDIPDRPASYRIEIRDDFNFTNLNPPRRGISLIPDRPPVVDLLDEVAKGPGDPGPLEDYEVRGMPLVEGGQVQIGYASRSSLGLSKAYIVYRVSRGQDWEPTWYALPLKLVVADTGKVGEFVPELGVFESYDHLGSVEFYPIPAIDADVEPDGLKAGGRYNFQTAALTKMGPNGQPAKLDIGDRVEFYVAVYDRKPVLQQPPTDRNATGRMPGISESRIKTVVTTSQLEEWNRQRDQSRERLRRIEELQRGVFGQGRNPN